MDARLQALLDKQAITDLVHAYCNAADRHDHDKMRALYHEDATDDHGAFFKGLAVDFIDQLPAIQEPMQILHHNVTTVNIALDGDYAEGEIYVLAFHQVRTDDGPADLLIGGRYFDQYEKRDGEWKYSHRAVVADWATFNNPSTVQLDHPMVAGSHIGRPGPDDPSYDFFRLLKRGQR
ncbi:MAG: nuclear transport factor 2 family protein [Halioglobus sp.]|nr:nuclear transport factor 2 family protein [Halioglobus sp.]